MRQQIYDFDREFCVCDFFSLRYTPMLIKKVYS